MIAIGDLHLKKKEPYYKNNKKFLDYLNDKYPYETLIFTGDETDTSSPEWDVFDYFSTFVKNRKSPVYIIGGNHTYSYRKGSVLEGLQHVPNVHVILEPTEIILYNLKCLFLPYKYDAKEYEKLTGTYDYIFTHITPVECAFANEGIQLQVKGTRIHGHTHIQTDFIDKITRDQHYVIGVPLPTRNGENQNHRILGIEDKQVNIINIPKFMEIKTISYGHFPEEKDNLYNITDAPSYDAVYQKYKDYYIRDKGISLLRTELTQQTEEMFSVGSLREKLQKYLKDEKIVSKEVYACCFEVFDRYEAIKDKEIDVQH